MRHLVATVLSAAVLVVALVWGFAWSGIYNVGADSPHWPLTYRFLSMLRKQSIQRHSVGIKVPNLDDPVLILKGAGQYAAMCTECHLAPGVRDSELRAGLYPKPPDLSREHVDPQRAFWILKHGIKMSAMPAWGRTHDDPTLWSIVAFVQKLPGMTAAQYRGIVAKAPPDEDMGSDAGAMPHAMHGN